jgi:hypothetical protein
MWNRHDDELHREHQSYAEPELCGSLRFSGFGFAELAIARFLCVTEKVSSELHPLLAYDVCGSSQNIPEISIIYICLPLPP